MLKKRPIICFIATLEGQSGYIPSHPARTNRLKLNFLSGLRRKGGKEERRKRGKEERRKRGKEEKRKEGKKERRRKEEGKKEKP